MSFIRKIFFVLLVFKTPYVEVSQHQGLINLWLEILNAARINGLNQTNFYRLRHSAKPVVLNEELNRLAQSYAQFLAYYNKFEHSKYTYGENLFKYCSFGHLLDLKDAAVEAVDNWYEEIYKYNFKRPRFNPLTGHFTQLVWRSTDEIGFGVGVGKDRREWCVWIVSLYNPIGNTVGWFSMNVKEPLQF